jgi:DNA-binding CsgD family transcriptional regulator
MTGTRVECGRPNCCHLAGRHDDKGRCQVPHCECKKFEGSFTPREFEVLLQFAQGKQGKEIGKILNMATKTVEAHRYNMMMKASTHSTLELVLRALRCGMIAITDLPDGPHDLVYFDKGKNAS